MGCVAFVHNYLRFGRSCEELCALIDKAVAAEDGVASAYRDNSARMHLVIERVGAAAGSGGRTRTKTRYTVSGPDTVKAALRAKANLPGRTKIQLSWFS